MRNLAPVIHNTCPYFFHARVCRLKSANVYQWEEHSLQLKSSVCWLLFQSLAWRRRVQYCFGMLFSSVLPFTSQCGCVIHLKSHSGWVHWWVKFNLYLTLSWSHSNSSCFLNNIYLFGCVGSSVLIVACGIGMRTLSCGMWDLILWPGVEPSFPALGAQC